VKSNNVNECNVNTLNARQLILKLLTVANHGILTISEALRAGELFEISENNIRVTIARLTKSNLVEIIERGSYRLGSKGLKLGSDVASWRSIEDRLVEWDGSWIVAATGGLPLSNRKDLRARIRALTMLGMLELNSTLYIRPNNLRGGVIAVRDRLSNLGLGSDAAVFLASEFDPKRQKRALNLWKDKVATISYDKHTTLLNSWLNKVDDLQLKTAARESYLLGDEAIRRIIFDPLLPAPFVDEESRNDFIETMKRFDDIGRKIWAKFLN